ncbi:endonuclease/exonuclease/phosphatase family metal-dependent hydrolase [Aeromicrobium panaciterrae]|uniref:Endonuclease/exonuclease/phosphatase family metal-dependent hydrolase n=1 Tax=Aeromicrobium panaciterrae TaxID=363861 RepID=A0ABU1UN13_9ACTN|nr:fibronectin type III domain-containing protein [Aeromicrobium panaciterrae]MDR7086548.1 endonuclease/exonuclease/phosphatase family metal-dependent hydrolase [Aeromicrobium panaciterrae]
MTRSPSTSSRLRARVGVFVGSVALLMSGAVVTGGAAQAIDAPTGLKAVDVASKGVALKWSNTGQGAYRVRMSTSSSMSSPEAWDVLDNYYEWTRTDASPSARAPRLTPGKTYYFQVKAIKRAADSSDRDSLSNYSSTLAVTLPTTALPELKPVKVKATAGGSTSLHVSWSDRGPGYSYLLRFTPNPDKSVTKWSSVKTDRPAVTLKGLTPGKTYYFRPRVIDSLGKGASPYGELGPSEATLESTPSPGLSVATYNIRKKYSDADWTARRKAVATNILTTAPDVIGIQEAIPTTYGVNGKKQYADLMDLMGDPYAYVTSGSGSSGTQLAYNTERLTKVKSGIKMLFEDGAAERYAVWAILKDKISDKSFFVVSTHLEPGTTTPELNAVRIHQAQDILDLVEDNANGRPTIIVGDMNTSRTAEPNNGQYKTFTGAGYIDPIDNSVANWFSGENATAEHIVNAQYSSANKLERKALLSSFPNGTHIDYMYTSPSIRVAVWRQVLNLDTTGSFVGTIPSDHNMMQMTIHLP